MYTNWFHNDCIKLYLFHIKYDFKMMYRFFGDCTSVHTHTVHTDNWFYLLQALYIFQTGFTMTILRSIYKVFVSDEI